MSIGGGRVGIGGGGFIFARSQLITLPRKRNKDIMYISITCGRNHKISVSILCNLVVLYADIHTILSKYDIMQI